MMYSVSDKSTNMKIQSSTRYVTGYVQRFQLTPQRFRTVSHAAHASTATHGHITCWERRAQLLRSRRCPGRAQRRTNTRATHPQRQALTRATTCATEGALTWRQPRLVL